MHHVVAQFHVLDDLSRTEQRRAQQPQRSAVAEQQHDPAAGHQRTLDGDGPPDVARVFLTARRLDVTADGVELGAEDLDVGVRRMCVGIDVCDGHVSP